MSAQARRTDRAGRQRRGIVLRCLCPPRGHGWREALLAEVRYGGFRRPRDVIKLASVESTSDPFGHAARLGFALLFDDSIPRDLLATTGQINQFAQREARTNCVA